MSHPKKPTPAASDDGLVTHTHTETPEQVAEYWTAERASGAKPVPMPGVEVPPPAATPTPLPMPTPTTPRKKSSDS